MQNQKVIERLGYSPSEAKVYLATLALGEAHISDISEKVNIPRSTVQVIVERLHKDGLMNFYVMHRYKYWTAEKPEYLLEKIKEREQLIVEAIPSLSKLKEIGRKHIKDKYSLDKLGPIRTVADIAAQAILITNSDVEIEYVNQAWEQLFDYTYEEVRGENPRLFKSSKTPTEVYKEMWRALRAGKLFQSDQIIDTKKDGTFIWLVTTIFQLKYGGRTFYIQVLEESIEHSHSSVLHEKLIEVTREE